MEKTAPNSLDNLTEEQKRSAQELSLPLAALKTSPPVGLWEATLAAKNRRVEVLRRRAGWGMLVCGVYMLISGYFLGYDLTLYETPTFLQVLLLEEWGEVFWSEISEVIPMVALASFVAGLLVEAFFVHLFWRLSPKGGEGVTLHRASHA